jgi:hypothetical protein
MSVRGLTLAVLILVLPVTAVPQHAEATATRPGASVTLGIRLADHGPHNGNEGNGRHVKNYTAVNSPTINRGAQQISISISDRTKTQAAFCKKTRTCRNSQRMGTSHGW